LRRRLAGEKGKSKHASLWTFWWMGLGFSIWLREI
jgi:hypothetical protein